MDDGVGKADVFDVEGTCIATNKGARSVRRKWGIGVGGLEGVRSLAQ
jgi:hypothetical protein